jgi:SAM-dependent MidA family methyltransferase
VSTEKLQGTMLAERLAERIRNEGKITFHDWMAEALYHPNVGYYNRSDLKRWGREGDYRTSPERSELFAATFARYFASLHKRLGEPSEWLVVEIGAGGGHFAAGVLETLKQRFSSVYESMHYLVVDVSEDARKRAAERLGRFDNFAFVELKDLKPGNSMVVFSNELLDAFPVHRVTKINGELKEFYVTVSNESKFEWIVDEVSDDSVAELCNPALAEGQIAEVSPTVVRWFEQLDQKVESGYVITVDYGAESEELYDPTQRKRGTLRAFRRHQFVNDVLESPGECDITSSVDWTFVKTVGQRHGFEVDEFGRLDKFLTDVGILQELEERLANSSSEAERSLLTTDAREMILPGGMASSFQVLVQKR